MLALVPTMMSSTKKDFFNQQINNLNADLGQTVKNDLIDTTTDKMISDIVKGEIVIDLKIEPK